MDSERLQSADLKGIKTPYYIISETKLEDNLKILQKVKERTGCTILLALKAFSMYSVFPLISKYLDGVCASGLNEAKLGYEEFEKQVHTYSPAYKDNEIKEIINISDTVIFNSLNQLEKYKDKAVSAGKQIGLRINPEYSEVKVKLYNPCSDNSRLGITRDELKEIDISEVSGLHFHVMCEQGADTLENVLERVEEKFGGLLEKIQWINFGGGHHITRSDYDIELLVKLINDFKAKYEVEVILEPGEAVALDAGFLVTEVIDIINKCIPVAIVDTSAEAHMPDVLAMPYRPDVIGSGKPGEKEYLYRLGGITCLAGDIIGDYSFSSRLNVGDRIVLKDMAHYSMVKNTTFNGINLPSIYVYTQEGKGELVKKFDYADYKSRV